MSGQYKLPSGEMTSDTIAWADALFWEITRRSPHHLGTLYAVLFTKLPKLVLLVRTELSNHARRLFLLWSNVPPTTRDLDL